MSYLLNPLFVLLLTCGSATGQSVFDLFYAEESSTAVEATLTLPMDSLAARSRQDQPGHFTFTDRAGIQRFFSVDLSIRGKFRQTRCSQPPLKLDFSKSELAAGGLAKHDKYKLVTTCYDDASASDLLLKEYLAYRVYALLSPGAHFRAQLLRITYRDMANGERSRTEYAFLIEDTDEMAARAGGKELDNAIGRPAADFDAEAEATHALFQYFIGNADYSLPLQRNVKLIERTDGKLIPVGYDFDFSGWVGAPYASPSSDNGQQSIYERVYLGYQQSDRTLREVSHDFRQQRRQVLHTIGDFRLLPGTERQILQRWVGRFYDQLASMNSLAGDNLYLQLRGATAAIIPPGAERRSYLGGGAAVRR